MEKYPLNSIFSLRVNLADTKEEITIQLRRGAQKRFLKATVENKSTVDRENFFGARTIDGKYIALNINKIQSVNILEDVVPWVLDPKVYRGPIRFLIAGKTDYIEVMTSESPELLYDCFLHLEDGPLDDGKFIRFFDEDEEDMIINMNELLYIEAPEILVDRGIDMCMGDHDLDSELE